MSHVCRTPWIVVSVCAFMALCRSAIADDASVSSDHPLERLTQRPLDFRCIDMIPEGGIAMTSNKRSTSKEDCRSSMSTATSWSAITRGSAL